jgi:phenylalanyl-tRNA synthetase beta chain
MKVLHSWLREFVDLRDNAEEIARIMSLRGFAVEGIESIGVPAGASAKAGDGDSVIDFEVTGNRPDCMSILGMAREIATAFNLPLMADSLSVRPPALNGLPPAEPALQTISITLENPDLCPYYVGGVMDVTVGPSPDWMQARLKAGGVRPISNIVDVTNYVLLELGQPMHAFDAAKLAKNEIRVRTAREGERLKTLDGQERTLTSDMLVIADGVHPVGIAGIMGGADSEVTGSTTTIVLESAYFNPLSVRRTSRKLGLKTEASTRFERGTDRELPATALRRACVLLEQIGAGKPRATIVAGNPSTLDRRVVTLRRDRVSSLIGITVADEQIRRILAGLGFDVAAAPDGWAVTVPPRRVDVSREVDLIEEIARHHGFDKIPGHFPALRQPPAEIDPRIMRARQLRSVMTGAGFSEANSFGFVARSAAASFAADDDLVAIANPLSENFGVLRPSCLPGLVDAVAHNRHREQRDVRLFEIGARFTRRAGERRVIAAVWAGTTGSDHWAGGTRPVDFFDMKGVAERIASAIGLDVRAEPVERVRRVPAESPTAAGGPAVSWVVPGRAAALMHDDTVLGYVGLLSPVVADQRGLSAADAVYVVELDLDAAEAIVSDRTTAVEALPRFPSVARDISILVDETLQAVEVRQTIREAAPEMLVRVREFDRYQGKGVPEGKVSLSLRLTFRSADRTLTDAEVQKAMDDVLSALRSRHDAVQR